MPGKVSQSIKDSCYTISPTRGTQSSQIHRDRNENGGCQGLWERGVGNYCSMGTVSVWEDEVLEMDGGVGCTAMCMCLMPQNCTLKKVKTVNFMLYISYHTQRDHLCHSERTARA